MILLQKKWKIFYGDVEDRVHPYVHLLEALALSWCPSQGKKMDETPQKYHYVKWIDTQIKYYLWFLENVKYSLLLITIYELRD